MADYAQYDRFDLVNRKTGFMLILIICNNTFGYAGGPERGIALRTPELLIQRLFLTSHYLPPALSMQPSWQPPNFPLL